MRRPGPFPRALTVLAAPVTAAADGSRPNISAMPASRDRRGDHTPAPCGPARGRQCAKQRMIPSAIDPFFMGQHQGRLV